MTVRKPVTRSAIVPRRGKPRERVIDLLRDRPRRNAGLGRLPPQIAEDAVKWTFAIREKNRGDLFDPALGRDLGLDQKRVG